MLSGGLQCVAIVSRHCGRQSLLFIFGLILAMLSKVQSNKELCSNILPRYEHCELQPDDVHGLNCFGKYNFKGLKTCVWKPGNTTLEKTYTIIIQQNEKKCDVHYNISDFCLSSIRVSMKSNMTVVVVVNGESSDCKKSVFRGSPRSLLQCDAPSKVFFSRQSEKLNLNVSWFNPTPIGFYSVRYKAVGSPSWSETPSRSHNKERCTVENLNTSLFYNVQIQCVTNEKCTLCPWSEIYTIPPELTTRPVLVKHEDTDIAGQRGTRLLSLKWKYSSEGLHDSYSVTVSKSSGEPPRELLSITQPEISLLLSYSGYQLYISAANNVSTSPALSWAIPRRELIPSAEAKLTVSVRSSTSLALHWKDDLIKTYVCYSAEWSEKGHKTVAMSFYQNKMNNKTLSPLPEALEPYKRYLISLHTRPQKQTCNIKRINNSESTYASTQFYLKEGAPVTAPYINISNISLMSVVLQWTTIPEADVRGFLLGYFIHYTEYLNQGVSTEKNVTVDPTCESYKLGDLKAATAYQIQVSGFTSAGAGVRSSATVIKTLEDQGYFYLNFIIPVIFFAIVAMVLICRCFLMKRAKVLLWPSIPHPGKSSALQKMETPFEMELLASLKTLKVEEWDTDGLQVIENNNMVLPGHVPFFFPLLSETEEVKDSLEITCDWIQTDTEDAAEDDNATASTTNFQQTTFAFSSDYTTMEMFQQAMPKAATAVNTAVSQDIEGDAAGGGVLQDMWVSVTPVQHWPVRRWPQYWCK
ncbi:leukemia inhibitory factor receptor isoform X2 [Cynoglossus semilaevis]|uniref:leukemia inhibitory factor receptor isoform X2 n=1 Tax=Cynoglossus semilaevis TaxID=244447 RepID=UPI000495713B|nr:leukemia inhibitory factor receptor-like isoform X2 [Cynoglossus semilaevis]